jgi:hypothetical protein
MADDLSPLKSPIISQPSESPTKRRQQRFVGGGYRKTQKSLNVPWREF